MSRQSPTAGDAARHLSRTQTPARDSLELASLASSSRSSRHSVSSSASGPPSSRKLSSDEEDPLHAQHPAANGSRGHDRSFSVSSAFDFAPPIFPLSSTNGYASLGDPSSLDRSISTHGAALERNKTLTYLNGLSLIVGMIIGSGIFSSPSEVNRNAGSPGGALIIWTFAGLLTWTGAASFTELGGAIPLNGGAQVYLAKIFGEGVGFLFSWCAVWVLKTGGAAIIAIIFGEYTVRAVTGADAATVNPWINKAVAIAAVAVVTLLNAISTRTAARCADIFMFFKFAALLAVGVMGIFVAVTGFSWYGNTSDDWKTVGWFEGTSTDLSRLAVALYAGLWAFDGWDNINYVTGELVNHTRDLPRIVHTALPLVIVCYALANISYFLVLPLETTFSSQTTTIAVDFGGQVLGPIGALVLALAVAGTCFGTLNAGIFTSSRLFYAGAKEGYLPSIIGTLGFRGSHAMRLPSHPGSATPKSHGFFARAMARLFADESNALFLTPIAALILNFVLTSVYISVGTFTTLITFYGIAGYFFYFLTVLGLLVLRVKEPDLERPYRCWITTPIVFCCVSLFLLSRSVIASPLTTLSVVIFVVAGVIVYLWKVKKRPVDAGSASQGEWWKFWSRSGRVS